MANGGADETVSDVINVVNSILVCYYSNWFQPAFLSSFSLSILIVRVSYFVISEAIGERLEEKVRVNKGLLTTRR